MGNSCLPIRILPAIGIHRTGHQIVHHQKVRMQKYKLVFDYSIQQMECSFFISCFNVVALEVNTADHFCRMQFI
ncbi:hypothetical protein D3C81_1851020 [compost metagenome]